MRISILGAGAIGSLFAYRFVRAGHDVTMVARGARLETLRRTNGVLKVRHLLRGSEDEVTVSVSDTLDVTPPPDLLLVTVRRQHADALLAGVSASRARQIMFMFNIAGDLSRFREAVGRERFSWGFPAAVAAFEGDVLVYSVVPSLLRALQITTIGGLAGFEPPGLAELHALLSQAQIPNAMCPDMGSWLETHAAFMAPLISAGLLSKQAGALTWGEAGLVASAMGAGFGAVRHTGARILPWNMALLRHVPTVLKTLSLWLAFRFGRVRAALGGEHARGEAEAMLEDLEALSPENAAPLVRLRAAIGRSPSNV